MLIYTYNLACMQWLQPLLPPTNEVWSKVICLYLSVILFTGGVYSWGCLRLGVSAPGVSALGGSATGGVPGPKGSDWSQGGAWSQGG